ncbi:UNKNOWN [Stylonychia lemnae]|uniref:Uncharacterized protein n=1 Tax=Stylonychia lemnae TaxID=5949 RepID=A0A078B7E0_STYLE|nr:UNKNOWN [Stylonychia lemnae]|eukprot:CDW89468.1 UNKNOWN [Stylonychia lemnae]
MESSQNNRSSQFPISLSSQQQQSLQNSGSTLEDQKFTIFVKMLDGRTKIIFVSATCKISCLRSKREVKTFHLSCRSTGPKQWKDNDIGGIIIYDQFKNQDLRIQPGYVYVRKIDEIKEYKSAEGQIHGNLLKSLLGIEPSQANLLCSGFGRKSGEDWKFNSLTLNTKDKEFQDDRKEMNQTEQELIKRALARWEKGDRQNVPVSTIVCFCVICKRHKEEFNDAVYRCDGRHIYNISKFCQNCGNYPYQVKMRDEDAFDYFAMKFDMAAGTQIKGQRQLIKQSLEDACQEEI